MEYCCNSFESAVKDGRIDVGYKENDDRVYWYYKPVLENGETYEQWLGRFKCEIGSFKPAPLQDIVYLDECPFGEHPLKK